MTTFLKNGNPVYKPISTKEEAEKLANNMVRHGNYPAGMSPCFVAGINGDSQENGDCLFKGQDFCTCEELLN